MKKGEKLYYYYEDYYEDTRGPLVRELEILKKDSSRLHAIVTKEIAGEDYLMKVGYKKWWWTSEINNIYIFTNRELIKKLL
jgi:hypothetical protein